MDASKVINPRKIIQKSSRGERPRIAILGGHMEWILTAAETNGHYSVLETFIPPGAGVPPRLLCAKAGGKAFELGGAPVMRKQRGATRENRSG